MCARGREYIRSCGACKRTKLSHKHQLRRRPSICRHGFSRKWISVLLSCLYKLLHSFRSPFSARRITTRVAPEILSALWDRHGAIEAVMTRNAKLLPASARQIGLGTPQYSSCKVCFNASANERARRAHSRSPVLAMLSTIAFTLDAARP